MMHTLKNVFTRLKKFVTQNPLVLALVIVVGIAYLINSRYVDYPDEYINFLAGKTILSGGLPYRDFWDHHLPFAWYYGAVLLFFSHGSFVIARVLWALTQFVGFSVLGRWIIKKHPHLKKYYAVFYLLYPFVSLYFWFHLFLADSLAIFFFSLTFWMLLATTIDLHNGKKLDLRDLYLSSFFVFCMIFSSASYLYMGVVLYIWHAYLLRFKINRQMVSLVTFSAVPYMLFFLYLLVTLTWSDFYFANFVYNTKYYISIPNYVRGAHFNPLKFSMTLVANFFEGYLPLLSKIKYLDLYLPVHTLAAISTLTLFFLLFSRSWILGALYFFIVSFSAPRSNVQSFKETDYQVGMFLTVGLISSFFVVYLLREIKEKEEWLAELKRVARFLTVTFLLFTGIFLVINTYTVGYKIYTQQLPSIHNMGYAALFVDEVLDPGDYYFIGPYEPNESFYVKKGQWIGRHPSLLPQFREGDELRTSFLKQFSDHPPKIIIYLQQTSIFGTPSLEFGKFFLDSIKSNYTSIEHIKGVTVLRSPTPFDIKTDLYLENSKQEELLQKLVTLGYITYAKPENTKK